MLLTGSIVAAMQLSSRPAPIAAGTVNVSGLHSTPVADAVDSERMSAAGVTQPSETKLSEPTDVEPREPLKGTDLDGHQHRLGESSGCRAVVAVFLGTQCPISNSILPRLNSLAEQCRTRGVEVFGVISSPSVSRAEARTHSLDFGITFPVLFDASGEMRSRLNATRSPHAFVLSSLGTTLYSGAFDDQFPSVTRRRTQPTVNYVQTALADVLDGRNVGVARTEPVGCLLEPLAERTATGQTTFAREIAPIIYGNCTQCHRAGTVAPFPLESYEDVVRHAAQIRLMVELKLMPPWKPVRGFGHLRDEMVLTQAEIDLVTRWIADGLPLGDPAEVPAAPQFSDGWELGTPDLVLEVPAFDVPADGNDIYQYFVIASGVTEDRLVRAIEYQSENPQLVHHASFRYDDAGEARQLDQSQPGPGYQRFGGWGFETGGTLGGWAVGIRPQPLTPGYGRPMRAGCDFVVQTHYHPNGRAATDRARVGIYFAAKSARRRIGELSVANVNLHLPPGVRGHRHRATYTLPTETIIHGVLPHTHLLGRDTRAVAILPNGRVEPLIWIDDWDFNWQSSYQYARPLRFPAGTRIEFDVIFDNSDRNPMNPASQPVWVHWGESSADEMAVCFFDVSTPDDADLDALIDDNREHIYSQRRGEQ